MDFSWVIAFLGGSAAVTSLAHLLGAVICESFRLVGGQLT
jgi:hypothetical protein